MKKSLFVILLICLFVLCGCQKKWTPLGEDVKTIKVGASPSPHAEILEIAKKIMAKDGFTLEIVTMSDYIIPNTSLEEGEIDANYFQHINYLNDFNEKNNTHIVSVGVVHYEPLGLYGGKKTSLDQISNKDKVIIPNDPTNEARALLLLESLGLIKLKEGAGLAATKNSIVDNPLQLEIVEIEAAQIPASRIDGAYAIINGNYAIEAKIDIKTALATESVEGLAAQYYANILAVRKGNENHPAIKALYSALTSQEVKDYINKNYGGAVVPLF